MNCCHYVTGFPVTSRSDKNTVDLMKGDRKRQLRLRTKVPSRAQKNVYIIKLTIGFWLLVETLFKPTTHKAH